MSDKLKKENVILLYAAKDTVYNHAVIFEFIEEIKITEIVNKILYFIENGINYKVILSIKDELRFDNELQTFGNFYLSFITNDVKI